MGGFLHAPERDARVPPTSNCPRSSLQCDNVCRPQHDTVRASNDTLVQQMDKLNQLQNAAIPDAAAIAAQQAIVIETRATIVTLTAAATKCDAECQANLDTQVAACVAD